LINHRIHPGQTLEQVIHHDSSVMDEPSVNITVQSYYAQMKISPYGPAVPQYVLIAKSIKEIYPDSIVAPGTYCASIAGTIALRYNASVIHIQRALPPTRTCSSIRTYQNISIV